MLIFDLRKLPTDREYEHSIVDGTPYHGDREGTVFIANRIQLYPFVMIRVRVE